MTAANPEKKRPQSGQAAQAEKAKRTKQETKSEPSASAPTPVASKAPPPAAATVPSAVVTTKIDWPSEEDAASVNGFDIMRKVIPNAPRPTIYARHRMLR